MILFFWLINIISCQIHTYHIDSVQVLTRQLIDSENNIFQLKKLSYCPNNFFGRQCERSKKINCLFRGLETEYTQITDEIPQEIQVNFTFSMECFIHQFKKEQIAQQQYENEINKNIFNQFFGNPIAANQSKKNQQFKPFEKKFIRLETYMQQYKKQDHTNIYKQQHIEFQPLRYTNNYDFIDQNNTIQILWINDSSRFDNNGRLIMPNIENQTKQQFNKRQLQKLNQYRPYEFQYTDEIVGFKLYNMNISYYLNMIQFDKPPMFNHLGRIIPIRLNQNGDIRLLQESSTVKGIIKDRFGFDFDQQIGAQIFTLHQNLPIYKFSYKIPTKSIIHIQLSSDISHFYRIYHIENGQKIINPGFEVVRQTYLLNDAQWKINLWDNTPVGSIISNGPNKIAIIIIGGIIMTSIFTLIGWYICKIKKQALPNNVLIEEQN